MPTTTLPTTPVDGWEKIRDEWIDSVAEVIHQAEEWSRNKGWHTAIQPKEMEEEELGTYSLPRLWIFADRGKLLLDPVARFVAAADGLIDLTSVPEFHNMLLARMPDGWTVFPLHTEGERFPWTAETFERVATELDRRR